jgi:hypothetical protein
MMQRKVTKGRDELAKKLSGARGGDFVLVFDGKRGEQEISSGSDPRVVITQGADDNGGMRVKADNWILTQIDACEEREIQVVTADREFRKLAQAKRAKTINPVKFWRRYLPRLKGLKSDYSNTPKEVV